MSFWYEMCLYVIYIYSKTDLAAVGIWLNFFLPSAYSTLCGSVLFLPYRKLKGLWDLEFFRCQWNKVFCKFCLICNLIRTVNNNIILKKDCYWMDLYFPAHSITISSRTFLVINSLFSLSSPLLHCLSSTVTVAISYDNYTICLHSFHFIK